MPRAKKTEVVKATKDLTSTTPSITEEVKKMLNKTENFLHNRIWVVQSQLEMVQDDIKSQMSWITLLIIWIIIIATWILWSKINDSSVTVDIHWMKTELNLIEDAMQDINRELYQIHNRVFEVDENNCIEWRDWTLYCKK